MEIPWWLRRRLADVLGLIGWIACAVGLFWVTSWLSHAAAAYRPSCTEVQLDYFDTSMSIAACSATTWDHVLKFLHDYMLVGLQVLHWGGPAVIIVGIGFIVRDVVQDPAWRRRSDTSANSSPL